MSKRVQKYWVEVYCYQKGRRTYSPNRPVDELTVSAKEIHLKNSRQDSPRERAQYRAAYLNKKTEELRFSSSPYHIADWSPRIQRDPVTAVTHTLYFNYVTGSQRTYLWATPNVSHSTATEAVSIAQEVVKKKFDEIGTDALRQEENEQWIALHEKNSGLGFYYEIKSQRCVWTKHHLSDFELENQNVAKKGYSESTLSSVRSKPRSASTQCCLRNDAIKHRFPLRYLTYNKFAKLRASHPHALILSINSSRLCTQPHHFLSEKTKSNNSILQISDSSSKASHVAQNTTVNCPENVGEVICGESKKKIISPFMKKLANQLDLISQSVGQQYHGVDYGDVSKKLPPANTNSMLVPNRKEYFQLDSMDIPDKTKETSYEAYTSKSKAKLSHEKLELAQQLTLQLLQEKGSCWRRFYSSSHDCSYFVYYKVGAVPSAIDVTSVWRLPQGPKGFKVNIDTLGFVTWNRTFTESLSNKAMFDVEKRSPRSGNLPTSHYYDLHFEIQGQTRTKSSLSISQHVSDLKAAVNEEMAATEKTKEECSNAFQKMDDEAMRIQIRHPDFCDNADEKSGEAFSDQISDGDELVNTSAPLDGSNLEDLDDVDNKPKDNTLQTQSFSKKYESLKVQLPRDDQEYRDVPAVRADNATPRSRYLLLRQENFKNCSLNAGYEDENDDQDGETFLERSLRRHRQYVEKGTEYYSDNYGTDTSEEDSFSELSY